MAETALFSRESELPGAILYHHPEEFRPSEAFRLWEVHQIVLPDGDLRYAGFAGGWGAAYDATRFAQGREAALRAAAAAAGGEVSPTELAILTSQFRVERRDAG